MSRIIRFIKDWALPISMTTGVLAYFAFRACHFAPEVGVMAERAVKVIQPFFLFCMLFVSFSKIDPKQLRIEKWHFRVLGLQVVSFVAMALAIYFLHLEGPARVLVESAMLCMICPTATAAVVITDKLGGNISSVVTYTIMINVTAAFVVSLCVPMINPDSQMSFLYAFWTMITKVFSLLVAPFILAVAIRVFLPKVNCAITEIRDLAFYIWIVSLALAMAVTARSIVHSPLEWYFVVAIGAIAIACCMLQFYLGHIIGERHGDRITAGQAFGQKNTVFSIWMGYMFMDPVTAVAGGLYSLGHNAVNSYQLYKKRHSA